MQVVSLYIDHILAADGDPNERPNPGWAGDVGVALAAQYGCTLYPSIRAALLAGENELSVDAVLIIAEVTRPSPPCAFTPADPSPRPAAPAWRLPLEREGAAHVITPFSPLAALHLTRAAG